MGLSSIFRFFEEMLNRKYDTDLASMNTNRALESIPDFFLRYLSRVYGLKKLAQKALSQMLVT